MRKKVQYRTSQKCYNTNLNLFAGIEILMGMRAARTLLAGAKQTHSQYLIRQFEKPGTYDQVLKEFNSVHPTDVQEFDLPGVVGLH